MDLLKVSAPARRWVIVAAGLSALGAALTIAAGLVAGHLISGIVDGTGLRYGLLAWLMILGVFRALVAWARARLGDLAADDVVSDLRRRSLAALAVRDPRTVDSAHWRTVLTGGLADFRPYLTRFLPAAIATFLATPAALVAIWLQDGSSAAIAAVTIPLIPFFMWLVGTLTQGRTEKKLADMALLNDQMLDLAAGLPTLVAHRQHNAPTVEVAHLADRHKRSTMDVLRIAFLSSMVLEFLATLSVALVAVNIGFRLLGGHMTLAAGLAILIIVPEVYAPIREVGARFHDAEDGATAAKAVFELLNSDPPPVVAAPIADSRSADDGLTLVFDDYSAPGRDGDRPHRLTGTALPGQITVLFGENGAGKSTALLAALGIAGGIGRAGVIAGQDGQVSAVTGDELWRRTAFLPQRPVLDETSLGDTSNLSLGQRQRAAFAQQVPGKELLVLDEPTAHLDSDNAEAMITELREAANRGVTVVAASHDPLLVAAADAVVDVKGTVRA